MNLVNLHIYILNLLHYRQILIDYDTSLENTCDILMKLTHDT